MPQQTDHWNIPLIKLLHQKHHDL